MAEPEQHASSVARFEKPPETGGRPQPRVIDALIRKSARTLFAQCRADYREWLSQSDLLSLFYAILRRELPAYYLPPSAVHVKYPCKLSPAQAAKLGRRGSTLPVDLILAVPHTIRILRGRHWEAKIAAAAQMKRGYERQREIRDDLAKLVVLREAWPDAHFYMIVMGYRSKQEDVGAVERAARAAGIPLLHDNYWGSEKSISQPELV